MRLHAIPRHSRISRFFRCLASAAIAWVLATPLASGVRAAAPVDFERQIRPLLVARCGACHGPQRRQGGLRLDVRHTALRGGDSGEVLAPGSSAESELWRRVTSVDESERMPPEGPRLSAAEVDLLRRWIDEGADWPATQVDRDAEIDRRREHWAFQPLSSPALPAAVAGDPAAAIDYFIGVRLAEQGLQPSPPADRRTLIRRMTFDLHGLPPGPEDVAAFAADADPDAAARLADKLLASPRYGERWGQHWLDVVRYADTHGFEVNTPRENAWPYRDYVIRAFNEDLPYDQFIREQLAGDSLEAGAATGFLVAAAVLLPGQIGQDEESKRLARQDALDEIVVGAGGSLLGLTIGCARCHDHKFDPLTARDYYAMQAFFAGVDYGDRPIESPERVRRLAAAERLGRQLDGVRAQLSRCEPLAFTGRTLVLDEADSRHTTRLRPPNGPGANPVGIGRGYRDDPGDSHRVGNISGGSYLWWNNVPQQDVLAYRFGTAGRFRLWISWGAHGSGVHTRDARYILDQDGDPATRDDQRELAKVDQYYPAGVVEGVTEKQPLWSGLLDVGVIDVTPESQLLVRGGATGGGVTADVIVLQEAPAANRAAPSGSEPAPNGAAPSNGAAGPTAASLPRLRSPIAASHNRERFPPVAARLVRFTTLETIDDNRHEPCLDELEIYSTGAAPRNVALAAAGGRASSSGNYAETGKHQLTHVNDGKYGNDWSWISNQRGGGWVQIELPEPIEIDRVEWGRDRSGAFADRLPVRYRIEVSLDGQRWQLVAGDEDRAPRGAPFDSVAALLRGAAAGDGCDVETARRLAEQAEQLAAEKSRWERPEVVYGGLFRSPDTTYVLRRGDPEQRLEAIPPAVPELFQERAGAPAAAALAELPEPRRRLALAQWIASPDNPLTARVMANRIWLHHFGRGLVATPSDFGLNGARPTHPELLDWLASELIRGGWSVKRLQRVILSSRTYRQSHRIDPRQARVDRGNRWLWRFPSRRLEGEAIRDSILSVSGELNLRGGGPGFNFFRTRGGLSGFPPVEEFGPEELRRMIYAHKIRMERAPVFGAFDCPDAGQATPLRSASITAIQALNLFNSPFVIERAAAFAARVEAEAGEGAGPQVRRAFELAFGRAPTDEELASTESVVAEHGLETLCRVLLNSNEFLFLP